MRTRLAILFVLLLAILLATKLVLTPHTTTPASSVYLLTADTPEAKAIGDSKNSASTAAADMARSKLFIGGREWNLRLTDESLSSHVQRRIADDLTLIFGHLRSFEIDVLPFPLVVDGHALDRRVRFEGGTVKRPDILVNTGFAHLVQGEGESSLFVPKLVSNAYLKALETEKAHKIAFENLDQFFVRLNEIAQHPNENFGDLLVFADDYKAEEGGGLPVRHSEFVKALGRRTYRSASILDITATAGTPLERYGPLTARTYARSAERLHDLPPLIFKDGQWRFLIQRPPT